MASTQEIQVLSDQLDLALSEKDWDKANFCFTQITQQLNLIEDFSALSAEQVKFLRQYHLKLQDQIAQLSKVRKELAKQIQPFNKKVPGYL